MQVRRGGLVAAKARGDQSPLQLTPRERDVLREMVECKNNAATASASAEARMRPATARASLVTRSVAAIERAGQVGRMPASFPLTCHHGCSAGWRFVASASDESVAASWTPA